ncbi:hypothetical protein N1031_17995 [Herbiconiux moechotypicola]|uniref:Bacteriocin n=1 Tax=Herbiconiux moechotypicola TaxID=637393 RepID=A0ABP5R3N9_9MICO|nr:hypothetical protein [Herbiconiux moechotypicola]MCS5731653.1 hypothetical protein [Herbiconiux moechotypicola]
MKTRSRTLAMTLCTTAAVVALVGGGAAAANAEMTSPPAQAYTDWDPAGVPSFNTYGGVPADMVGVWQMFQATGDGFYYGPIGGGYVSGGAVDHLNEYKGGTCVVVNDDTAVYCGY